MYCLILRMIDKIITYYFIYKMILWLKYLIAFILSYIFGDRIILLIELIQQFCAPNNELPNILIKYNQGTDLSLIEPINKVEFMEKYDKIRGTNSKVIKTSGSSGLVGTFVYSNYDWYKLKAVIAVQLFSDEIPTLLSKIIFNKLRISKIVAEGYTTDLLLIDDFNLIDIQYIPLESEDIIERLNIFKPHIIHLYPSMLVNIVKYLTFVPTIIITGSEYLHLRTKALVKEYLPKTRLIETYAATECPCIASSCKFGNLHINDNGCHVEIYPEKVLVTNLINTLQPLVRYELDDQIEYLDICECGKKIIKMHGRYQDNLFLPTIFGKDIMFTPSYFDDKLSNHTYQIIQLSKNKLLINYVDNDVNDIFYKIVMENNLDITWNTCKVTKLSRNKISLKVESIVPLRNLCSPESELMLVRKG